VGPARTTYLFSNHAVRTEWWRYIRYHDGGEELYDESRDPLEWTNLAGKPQYASLKASLARHFPKVNTPPPPGSTSRTRRMEEAAKGRREKGKLITVWR
jgi:choline-sulfatase